MFKNTLKQDQLVTERYPHDHMITTTLSMIIWLQIHCSWSNDRLSQFSNKFSSSPWLNGLSNNIFIYWCIRMSLSISFRIPCPCWISLYFYLLFAILELLCIYLIVETYPMCPCANSELFYDVFVPQEVNDHSSPMHLGPWLCLKYFASLPCVAYYRWFSRIPDSGSSLLQRDKKSFLYDAKVSVCKNRPTPPPPDEINYSIRIFFIRAWGYIVEIIVGLLLVCVSVQDHVRVHVRVHVCVHVRVQDLPSLSPNIASAERQSTLLADHIFTRITQLNIDKPLPKDQF